MNDVGLFISYAFEDFRHAHRLFASLAGIEEIKVWLDKETLLPGDSWEDEVLDAIARSRFFVPLISQTWVEKDGFFKQELEKAVECLKAKGQKEFTVIPVRIQPCDFEYEELRRLHYVDLFPNWDRGVDAIRKAIRGQIETDMEAAFNRLRDAAFEASTAEDAWCEEYGDYILRLAPVTIIRFLDKKHHKLKFELHAVDVLAHLASQKRSSTLPDYVLRTFEIVRMSGYPYEWPQYYGVVLKCASLLTENVRAMFLRDVLNYFIDHLATVYGGEWWGELALRDVVKHYLSCERAKQVIGADIRGRPFIGDVDVEFRVLDKCLDVMTWDLPLIDLLVFLGRWKRDPEVLRTAQSLMHRTGYDVGLATSESRNGSTYGSFSGFYSLKPRIDRIKPNVADHREEYSRLGLMLRIGEYLSEYTLGEGTLLKRKALDRLREHEPLIDDRVVELLTGEERTSIFNAIERQDDEALHFYLEDAEQRKSLLSLVREGVHARKNADSGFLPVPLPVSVFSGAGLELG